MLESASLSFEEAAHPRAQVLGLDDVNHRVVLVLVQVHSRQQGQLGCSLAEINGGLGYILMSEGLESVPASQHAGFGVSAEDVPESVADLAYRSIRADRVQDVRHGVFRALSGFM